jgi:hypothetical protein
VLSSGTVPAGLCGKRLLDVGSITLLSAGDEDEAGAVTVVVLCIRRNGAGVNTCAVFSVQCSEHDAVGWSTCAATQGTQQEHADCTAYAMPTASDTPDDEEAAAAAAAAAPLQAATVCTAVAWCQLSVKMSVQMGTGSGR